MINGKSMDHEVGPFQGEDDGHPPRPATVGFPTAMSPDRRGDPRPGGARGPLLLLSLDAASVASCRVRPRHLVDRIVRGMREGIIRVPFVIREARLAGIEEARADDEVALAERLSDTFETWWGRVWPDLVIPESPAVLAEAERLRRIPTIGGRMRGGDGPLEEVNLRIAATAAIHRATVLTMSRFSFDVYRAEAGIALEVVPTIDPAD